MRFTDSGRAYSRLLQSLRHQFLTTNMTQRVGGSVSSSSGDDEVSGSPASVEPRMSPLGQALSDAEQRQRQSVIDWARSGESNPLGSQTPPFQPFPRIGPDLENPTTANQSRRSVSSVDDAFLDSGKRNVEREVELHTSNPSQEGAPQSSEPSVSYLGFQVHHRYLVTQDESGMVVIDQHALHERVLYERVCHKVLEEGRPLESQRLLVPEPVSLTPAERTAAMDAKETLAKIGIEIDDFGGETILVQSCPAILGRVSPGEMLHTLLDAVVAAGKKPDAKDLLNHLLSTIACKAAVKAGDRLTADEITSLLEQKDLYQDTHHCPHGRPTALFFSRDELDRMFGRLGPRGRQ